MLFDRTSPTLSSLSFFDDKSENYPEYTPKLPNASPNTRLFANMTIKSFPRNRSNNVDYRDASRSRWPGPPAYLDIDEDTICSECFQNCPSNPIFSSMQSKHLQCLISSLKSNKYNINSPNYTDDDNLDTPLHIACKLSNINYVELLLNYGANPNVLNRRNETPLFLSCLFNSIDILRLLMSFTNNELLNIQENSTGNSALHISSKLGDLDCIKLLLLSRNKENNNEIININLQNFNGATPLHLSKNLDILLYLISFGADINIKDNYDRSIAFYHCIYNHDDIVEYLLSNYNDFITEVDYRKDTLLHAAVNNGCYEVLVILLHFPWFNSNINIKNEYGYTPLDVLPNSIKTDSKIYKLLKSYNAKTSYEIENENKIENNNIPTNWIRYIDPDTNYPYYYNIITKQSQWEIPTSSLTSEYLSDDNFDNDKEFIRELRMRSIPRKLSHDYELLAKQYKYEKPYRLTTFINKRKFNNNNNEKKNGLCLLCHFNEPDVCYLPCEHCCVCLVYI